MDEVRLRTDSRRAGFTLVEIVVAFALLAVLMVLALSVVANMSAPTTFVTLTAEMSSKGNATSMLLIRELQGGIYTDLDMTLGSYTGTGNVSTWNTSTPTMTDAAIQFKLVDTFDSVANTVNLKADDVLYAFEKDDTGDADRDGLKDEWRLIRISPPGSTPVIIQKDICAKNTTQGNIPPGVTVVDPFFELTRPSSLRVVFTLAKQTGYDTTTNTRLYSFVKFEHTIFLRNVE